MSKEIEEKPSIDDRLEKMKENETFITVKDQKDRFPHRVLCRLLNTSKTNIGKISKVLLDKTNSAVFSSIKINQSKNTSPIIT